MSGLHEISGRCHCGNIEYLFSSPIPKLELPIRTCGCSFCTKQGACYTSHPRGRLQVRVRQRKQIQRYRFGSEQAEVFLCTHCGVFPFILGEIDDKEYAVINANSINGLHIDRAALAPPLQLEEQSAEERSARWKQSWIPQVTINYQNQAVTAAILS